MDSVCLDQSKADWHKDPAFDGKSAVAGRHKAPSQPNCFDRSVVEGVETRRIRNLDALYGTVSADQHPDRHGALLFVSSGDGWIDGGRITCIIGVSDPIAPAAAAPFRRSAAWSSAVPHRVVAGTGP